MNVPRLWQSRLIPLPQRSRATHVKPDFHLSVDIIRRIQVTETDRCRHEPAHHRQTRYGQRTIISYLSNRGCPISPRWSSIGCISTTRCKTSLTSQASCKKLTASSRTSTAGSYSCVSSNRNVHEFAIGLARTSSPRCFVAYKRIC